MGLFFFGGAGVRELAPAFARAACCRAACAISHSFRLTEAPEASFLRQSGGKPPQSKKATTSKRHWSIWDCVKKKRRGKAGKTSNFQAQARGLKKIPEGRFSWKKYKMFQSLYTKHEKFPTKSPKPPLMTQALLRPRGWFCSGTDGIMRFSNWCWAYNEEGAYGEVYL